MLMAFWLSNMDLIDTICTKKVLYEHKDIDIKFCAERKKTLLSPYGQKF